VKYKIRVDGFNIEETEDMKELSYYQRVQKEREWARERGILSCKFIPIVTLSKRNFNK
jgi:hypothetical protein